MSYGAFTASNYLSTASTPVTAVPLTLACWFNSTDGTSQQDLVALTNTTDGTQIWCLRAGGGGGTDPLMGIVNGVSMVTSNTWNTGTWNSAVLVLTSATSRSLHLNAGTKTTNTSSATPTGINSIRLGHSLDNTEAPTKPLTGTLAEMAIWNVALTDAEVLSHSKGVSPLEIRPQSLVCYAPLIRDLQDIRGGLTISMTGTVAVANHPRIYGL